MARPITTLALAAAALAWASASQAAVTVFQGPAGLTAFNTAAGSPGIGISFEALSGGIGGSTIAGITFLSPDGNTLEVVGSTSTPGGFTGAPNPASNVLIPTSGDRVLSPGGSSLVPGSALGQRDSLQLDFTTPLGAFGMDILHQSFDCCTFASYAVFNSGGEIASGSIIGGAGLGGDPGGTSFFGVFSTAGDITRIIITEFDDNESFPDANLGYDTFRFATPGAVVPEPGTWALLILGFGLAGASLRRRPIHAA